jgi:hypothetical protein
MNASSPSCNTCGSWWRLPLLLAFVLVAIWLLRDRGVRDAKPDSGDTVQGTPAGSADASKAVSLTIDFGDGRRTEFEPVAWREGMTVRDVTRETPRADRRLDVRGSGEAAFLASLDGVANEGADGRNWIYSVNGKNGDRSFAIYELEPGDQVLWTFGKQQ